MKSDGLISGLGDTRTSGMLRRPVLLDGDPYLVEQLQGRAPAYGDDGEVTDPGTPGVWSRMVPTAELAAILWDGIFAGIGVGELIKDETGIPVLRHLDLHWVRYDYENDRFFYQTPGGITAVITPGDGRWVLFTPKGPKRAWMAGAWFPLAWPFISKAGTALDRLRWQGQLTDPLKVVQSSERSTEPQRRKLLKFITDLWHRSPALVLQSDEKAYLVESTGKGYEVFLDSEERADREIQFTLSGQIVTGDGNKGFSSGDLFDAIKNDLIQGTADAAGECVTRDIVAPWALRFWGCKDGPSATWDVRSPAQRQADAEALESALSTVEKADAQLAPRGQRVDLPAYLLSQRLTLPIEPLPGSAVNDSQSLVTLLQADDNQEAEGDSFATALAEKMTLHGVSKCEHGSSNRCRFCGVERTRDFDPSPTGEHTWHVTWRPIVRSTVKAATPGMVTVSV
jgi:hypothetical protein